MAQAMSIEAFRAVVSHLRDKYRPFHEGKTVWISELPDNNESDCNLKMPPWICQPYYRPPPAEARQMLAEKQEAAERRVKQKYFDKDGNAISRKKMKKLKRLEKRAKIKIERHGELCTKSDCDNTRGLKCDFDLCKICCRKKSSNEAVNCVGHKMFAKHKRERAELYERTMKMKTNDDGEHVGTAVEAVQSNPHEF